MFTAYRIGVTVSLTNQVSSVLGLIARDFTKSEAAAAKLKGTLKEISLLATTGVMLGGLGYAGLRISESVVKPALEYNQQLSIMNMAGMKQKEIAEAIGDAWQNTGKIITTTATQNLRWLLDLRNIMVSQERERSAGNMPPVGSAARMAIESADWQAARAALPLIARTQAALSAANPEVFGKGKGTDFAFEAAKALDIRGAVQNPQRFAAELERMGQVAIWSQGRITPAQFQSVLFYARQANMALSPDFVYGILPSLMLERAGGAGSQGGGSKGIGPAIAAFNRAVVQGYGISKKTLPILKELGLVGAGAALHTTTEGTTVGAMTGAHIAAKNQFLWATQVFEPRLMKYMAAHHIAPTLENELAIINQVSRGNQSFGWLLGQYIGKKGNALRDYELIGQAMTPTQAYNAALRNNPRFAFEALGAQWDNLKTAFGVTVVPVLIPAIIKLTTALNDFGMWAHKHEGVTTALMYSFIGLSTSLAFSGVVLTLTAGFKALGLILSVGGLAPKALTMLGANLGVAALGFAKIAGPLALVAGALALLGPSKSFTESQQDWLHSHGLGGESGTGSRLGGWVDSVAEAIKRALHGTSVQMDGKEVGKIVSDHQADEMSKPPADTARIDNKLAPVWPNYSFQQP